MPVNKIPDSSVRMVTDLLRDYKSPESMAHARWLKKMIDTAVRHVEYYITPLVSKQAIKIAEENNLGDLSTKGWRAPASWPAGKDLYFEHAKPAADVVKELLKIDEVTESKVRSVLMTAEVAWISRDEERRLPKYNRSDWREVYREKGIEV